MFFLQQAKHSASTTRNSYVPLGLPGFAHADALPGSTSSTTTTTTHCLPGRRLGRVTERQTQRQPPRPDLSFAALPALPCLLATFLAFTGPHTPTRHSLSVFFVLLQYPGLQCLTCSFSSPTPTPGSLSRPDQESHRPPPVDPDVDWPHALSPAQRIWPAVARLLLNTKPLLRRSITDHSLPPLPPAAASGCQESLPTGLCPASLSFPTASLPPGPPKSSLLANPRHGEYTTSPAFTFIHLSTAHLRHIHRLRCCNLSWHLIPAEFTHRVPCQCPSPRGRGRCGGAHGAAPQTGARCHTPPQGRHHPRLV